uniref:Putative site-specific DNA endonuclease n=1 Tax=Oltmannsiellopsis viridis TaxID=51324 RepID=Q20ET8_OLTVI|nr:putative site-specific DNA endonuclease [Oltmannsiellopsis viridis]YP_635907.1 putative site-specific DNA endonuclease [Oltmannsiellopsis viridis]ABB81975.1 putative site-specific DNA endonuclease [Oltmannsiellopsis viridis]ABB82016.1 putative site-specific DNA endonuclease [Oltmannsiellopsis viridis]
MVIPREDLLNITMNLTEQEKIYLGGFVDGDGCINAQIVRRKDYLLKFQIRVTVSFYQKTKRHWFIKWVHKKLKYGSIRKRNDGMSEYNIVGNHAVKKVVNELQPYIRIKQPQVRLVLEIIEKLPEAKDPLTFVALCERVDLFERLNDSKKRVITSETVRSELGID